MLCSKCVNIYVPFFYFYFTCFESITVSMYIETWCVSASVLLVYRDFKCHAIAFNRNAIEMCKGGICIYTFVKLVFISNNRKTL